MARHLGARLEYCLALTLVSEGTETTRSRFTGRLEAFSDLVFGFSLSLLATRLDVPARVEDVFDPARWIAVIGTFGFVCRFWLEHYRIFRHHFVADMSDAIINFVFLFAVAIMPYSVQTFLHFNVSIPSFTLYLGDFSLVLASLATLRVRSLRQRRNDPDVADRLRVWRRSVMQYIIAAAMALMLLSLNRHGGTVQSALRDLDTYLISAFAGAVIMGRLLVKRLPAFLA